MSKVVILALIAESCWETLKMTWQKDKYATIDRVGALALGIIVAVSTGFDILQFVDINSKIPFLGQVLSGILISRGSNFVHDFMQSLSNVNQNTKAL